MINRPGNIAACMVLMLAALFTASCSGGTNDNEHHKVSISGGETVDYTATEATLSIMSDTRWDISVKYDNESATGKWCTLSRTSGNGISSVNISFERNGGEERSVVFTVDFGNAAQSVRLTQKAYRDDPWLELPDFDDGEDDNFIMVTHFVPDKENMRNYTVYYDIVNHYPLWVAYPMHTSYYPSGSRSDAWQYDPKIAEEYQPDMSRGIRGYTRGHMLASASRYITQSNEQTFYFTNMTAQSSGFNSLETAWTDLEGRERGWGGTGNDTLYCVSGAVVRTAGGSESLIYAYTRSDENRDIPIAVPNYFYKAMVKQFEEKDGTHYYRGIAFWFKHENTYRDVQASDVISIRELEQKTGIDFFPDLPDDIEELVENEREPSLWGLS